MIEVSGGLTDFASEMPLGEVRRMIRQQGRIISIAVSIMLASAVSGAQAKRNSVREPIKRLDPIVIYPGYSRQRCAEPSPADKCYEVPPAFISEFAENKNCVGLTLKVLNSTEPDKWPDWWRQLQNDDHHRYWLVRIDFDFNLSAFDLPPYLGDVVGPDEVSHRLDDDLTSTTASPMREIVGKACALASGAIKGGKVEQ